MLVDSGKWRVWALFLYTHDSVGRTNSLRVETGVALNSLSEVIISTNISSNFVLMLFLMTIQTVVDSFHIFSISFVQVFAHVVKVPHIMIKDNMDLQGHGKRHIFMKVPEINFEVENCLFTSGIIVFF